MRFNWLLPLSGARGAHSGEYLFVLISGWLVLPPRPDSKSRSPWRQVDRGFETVRYHRSDPRTVLSAGLRGDTLRTKGLPVILWTPWPVTRFVSGPSSWTSRPESCTKTAARFAFRNNASKF